MRIPFITSAHNSLSQPLQVELVVTYRTAAMPRTNEVPLYFAGMPRAHSPAHAASRPSVAAGARATWETPLVSHGGGSRRRRSSTAELGSAGPYQARTQRRREGKQVFDCHGSLTRAQRRNDSSVSGGSYAQTPLNGRPHRSRYASRSAVLRHRPR